VRQLSEAVYPGGGGHRIRHRPQLLERLESKSCVPGARQGREYHPCHRPARRPDRSRAGGARRQDVRGLASAAVVALDSCQGLTARAARPARLGRSAQPREQGRQQGEARAKPKPGRRRTTGRRVSHVPGGRLEHAVAATLLAVIAVVVGRLAGSASSRMRVGSWFSSSS